MANLVHLEDAVGLVGWHRSSRLDRRLAVRLWSIPMLEVHKKIVAWLAWSLCLLCVGLASCAPLLWVLNGRPLIGFVREGDGAVVVLVISFSVVGALIVSPARRTP